MEDFIQQHPGVVIAMLSLLTTILSTLFVLLMGMVKGAVHRFEAAVLEAISVLRSDLAENRQSTGRLLDRMQRQETICEQRGKYCPGALGLRCPSEPSAEEQ